MMLNVLNTLSEKYVNVNYVRDMAYRLLAKENITALPVSAAEVLCRLPCHLMFYTEFTKFTPGELYENHGNAFICPAKNSERFIVGLNMDCNEFDRNWAIMQMIACVELGHLETLRGDAFWQFDKNFARAEAELFTHFALCPDIVAQKIRLRNPHDMQMLCRIPYHRAIQKSKYFSGFDYKVDSILPKSPAAQKVAFNFRDFIKDYNDKFRYEFSAELC